MLLLTIKNYSPRIILYSVLYSIIAFTAFVLPQLQDNSFNIFWHLPWITSLTFPPAIFISTYSFVQKTGFNYRVGHKYINIILMAIITLLALNNSFLVPFANKELSKKIETIDTLKSVNQDIRLENTINLIKLISNTKDSKKLNEIFNQLRVRFSFSFFILPIAYFAIFLNRFKLKTTIMRRLVNMAVFFTSLPLIVFLLHIVNTFNPNTVKFFITIPIIIFLILSISFHIINIRYNELKNAFK